MLTRAGFTLLGSGLTLLTAGLATGNMFYATLAFVPLGVLAAGLARDGPNRVSASIALSKPNPRAGEEVFVEVAYSVGAGSGPIEFHVPLPAPFELTSGANLHVVVKRRREPLSGTFAFAFVATARGEHRIGPVQVEAVHPAGLRAPQHADVSAAAAMDVRPREAPIRRVRGLAGYAKDLFPENDQAATGIRTTEFRELREYSFGDPLKTVNWKATARRASAAAAVGGTLTAPLVNEHEREGKKAVWLFIDAAPYMGIGANTESALDYAVTAALGVASFYLSRGYRLGAYVYNHDRGAVLHPDTGRRQLLQITRVLTGLKPGSTADEGLYAAIDRAKGWLVRDRPLVVIVTRLAKADERAFQAVRRLRALSGRRRRRIPVLVISPVAASAIPPPPDYGRDIVHLLRRHERPAVDRMRRMGARVIEWDPREAQLATLLLGSAPRGGVRK